MSSTALNYQRILEQMHRAVLARGDSSSRLPRLLAVSKTKPIEEILKLYHLGQQHFGENYVQELIQKATQIRDRGVDGVNFHFIGHLQRNKVKALLPHIVGIQSVDSIRLLEEISKQSELLGWNGYLLIQVNLDREPSKSGFYEQNLSELMEWIESRPQKLNLAGWMCIPDPKQDPTLTYQELRAIRDQYRAWVGPELSMGMSSDFESAIIEGATWIRVGSQLFGARE